jgi:hypothetical protein
MNCWNDWGYELGVLSLYYRLINEETERLGQHHIAERQSYVGVKPADRHAFHPIFVKIVYGLVTTIYRCPRSSSLDAP